MKNPSITLLDASKVYFPGIPTEFVSRWFTYIDLPFVEISPQQIHYIAGPGDLKTARELLEVESKKIGGRRFYHHILGRFTVNIKRRAS